MKNIAFLIIISLFFSCQRESDEDVFGDSPAERVEKKQQELFDELTSAENGWKLSYQTNDQKFGGFTFLMKFDANYNVVMSCDFSEETVSEQSSIYQIKTGQGTLLSFVTKNHIHNLADAVIGERGKGYEGEFEFVYIGKENNKLKFKTQRGTSKEIYFEKATTNDWTTVTNLMGSVSIFEKDSYRHFVRVTTPSGEKKDYRMSLNGLRYMTLRNFSNPAEQYKFGLTPTSSGFLLSPAPTFEGVTFSELIWDNNASPARYITKKDGVTMEILFSSNPRPEHITNDFEDIFTKVSQFEFQTSFLKNTPITSTLFKEEILTNESLDFNSLGVAFISNSQAVLYVFYDFGKGNIFLAVNVTYEIKDKKLYFTSAGGIRTRDANTFNIWSAPENQKYYNQALKALSGLYSLGRQGYSIEKRTEKYRWNEDIYVLQNGPYYFPTYGIK